MGHRGRGNEEQNVRIQSYGKREREDGDGKGGWKGRWILNVVMIFINWFVG